MKMLLGFHFFLSKAENEFSPAEDLGAIGYQTAINWECTLLTGEETDEIKPLKNSISDLLTQYSRYLHAYKDISLLILIGLLSELNTN